MADLKLIKFTSGEEIICTLISAGDGAKVVKDAVTLVYRPKEGGQMTVGFAPFMPYSDGTVSLYDSSIAAITEVNKDLTNEYNRIFGSGIVVASANDTAFKI
jgi:hypothetical protein